MPRNNIKLSDNKNLSACFHHGAAVTKGGNDISEITNTPAGVKAGAPFNCGPLCKKREEEGL